MKLRYPEVDWFVYQLAVVEVLTGLVTIVLSPIFYVVMFLYMNRRLFKGKTKV